MEEIVQSGRARALGVSATGRLPHRLLRQLHAKAKVTLLVSVSRREGEGGKEDGKGEDRREGEKSGEIEANGGETQRVREGLLQI
eukprot:56537-Amorphochlora_amoeboformis.AAC.1